MKKTFLYLTFLSLFAFMVTGCSKDEEYNADTAISYYKPYEYDRMVSSIAITYNDTVISNNTDTVIYKNRWTYNFVYDAQNRIKEIHGDTRFYTNATNEYWECTSLSSYFYNKETLKIECEYDIYLTEQKKNERLTPKYYGCFDKENGRLIQFYSFDCEYDDWGRMIGGHTDDETHFGLERDGDNNIIKAYMKDDSDEILPKTVREFEYSHRVNKTNIDFASFFGYNIVERNVDLNKKHPYELFHLGAFEMLGGRGNNLPLGEVLYDKDGNRRPSGVWTFDKEGYPTKYVSPVGVVYVIKYKE
jgi:hypothetical protein